MDMNEQSNNYLLEEMNAIQVRDKITEKTIAILVLGACENHGNHMPFGSDFIFPMKLFEKVVDEISNDDIQRPSKTKAISFFFPPSRMELVHTTTTFK